MNEVTFSIILTTYNRCKLLRKAIQSVLNQSFTNFELIIIDDASTDQTPAIVREFEDLRIRYIRQPHNQGVGAARNLGISQARGTYVAFLDDDDTLSPDYLREVDAVLCRASPRVGFLLSGRQIIQTTDDGETIVGTITYGPKDVTFREGYRFFERLSGGAGGLVVRRSCFSKTGCFNTEFRNAEDTELLIRLALQYDYVVLPKPIYHVRRHPGEQLTDPSIACAQAHAKLLRLHHDTLRHYPRVMRGLYKHAAAMFYQAKAPSEGRRLYLRILQEYPWRIDFAAYFLLLEIARYLPKVLANPVYTMRRKRN